MKVARVLTLLGLGLFSACSNNAPARDAAPVAVSLRNDGTAPMECRLMFGHWVDRDLGRLPPGGQVSFSVEQQPSDGGLFVMRPDGKMRMMIETILCGQYPDWPGSVGQVDLGPARRKLVSAINASCRMPPEGGRIACPPVTLTAAP
ncbi:hypothetical protein [Dongia sp.]|uniref:hypothetical protein n=1 Tax=Dongia sp. TaxID=1977262 RepID=UPI0035B12EF7